MNRASETRGTQTFQYTQRRIPEGEEREKGAKRIFEETMVKNLLNLTKNPPQKLNPNNYLNTQGTQ